LPATVPADAQVYERHGEGRWGLMACITSMDCVFLQCLAGVVDLLAHPNSPVIQQSPAPHHGHMTWCHYSWDHVIPTLKQWLKELNGLKVRGALISFNFCT